MPLNNYADLQDLDAAQIRRLLDPRTFDASEVNRVAAERALGGGGFSGARQNRLLESELNQRALQGHQMLTPYLQMEQQTKMQTQSEAATMARQLEADKQAFDRLRFSTDANDQQQAREIGERIRSQTQALQAQQAENEKNRLFQTGTQERGIKADLERLAYIDKLQQSSRQVSNPLNRQTGVSMIGGGSQPVSSSGGRMGQPTGNTGPNSATMAEVNRLIGGGGNGSGTNFNPNLSRGGKLGTTMFGNDEQGYSAPGWTSGSRSSGYGNYGGHPAPVTGDYQDNFANSTDPYSYDWAGIDNINQPTWQSGSNPNELIWGGVDDQLKNKGNWASNSFDASLYA